MAVEGEREAAAVQSRAALTRFLADKFGTALKAWLWHLDPDNDKHVGQKAFVKCLERWGFPGDADAVFADCDSDHSGQLIFSEIDKDQDALWRNFTDWCCANFKDVEDMRCKFQQLEKYEDNARRPITKEVFVAGVRKAGWTGDNEAFLFDALDSDCSGSLEVMDLMFLENEFRRYRKKLQARQKASEQSPRRRRCKEESRLAVYRFKRFLKSRYGNYIRAWRVGLCPGDAARTRQNQFLKSCADIGWVRDGKLLWKVFDDDEDGWMVIDQLDLKTAESLAKFREFVFRVFGSASAAFKAFDRRGLKKLRQEEFLEALQSHGFTNGGKQLFQGLDKTAGKYLQEDDLLFVDAWQPLPFLTAAPDYAAFQDLKSALLRKYKTLLGAWRHALDPDGSNHCTWIEFVAACAKVSYKGNVAGAWRAVDEELSGFVTFAELDRATSQSIEQFKQWADAEFGSVRSLYNVFVDKSSRELTFKDFRSSCRGYGYIDDIMFFKVLDPDNKGLALEQLAWIDMWDFKSIDWPDSDVEIAQVPQIRASVIDTDAFHKAQLGGGAEALGIQNHRPASLRKRLSLSPTKTPPPSPMSSQSPSLSQGPSRINGRSPSPVNARSAPSPSPHHRRSTSPAKARPPSPVPRCHQAQAQQEKQLRTPRHKKHPQRRQQPRQPQQQQRTLRRMGREKEPDEHVDAPFVSHGTRCDQARERRRGRESADEDERMGGPKGVAASDAAELQLPYVACADTGIGVLSSEHTGEAKRLLPGLDELLSISCRPFQKRRQRPLFRNTDGIDCDRSSRSRTYDMYGQDLRATLPVLGKPEKHGCIDMPGLKVH